tara:strand:- start:574 stop:780 length:207 start_codon:yes stop_codon:yes gene_type:complete
MNNSRMPNPDESEISPKNYRWPLFACLFAILWVLLTVLWMAWGVNQTKKEKEQRLQMDPFGNQLEQVD